ncbi:MAG: TIGR02449 family protein [Pseudomonadales bacterium]|nr:TIGR02449 family protein [Pseudomonadales bacterium]
MAINDLEALEDKVDELIALCEVLVEENQVLKSNQQSWTNERAKLVEKNESAKARVESMIARLKALDK